MKSNAESHVDESSKTKYQFKHGTVSTRGKNADDSRKANNQCPAKFTNATPIDDELHEKLQKRLIKVDDPSALEEIEAKVKKCIDKRRKDDEVRKQKNFQ